MTMTQHFFAPCPRGLEAVLADELTALGAQNVKAVDGGAGFAGDFALCYRANLWSRVASRILWKVGEAPYKNEEDIYRLALGLPWPEWFDVSRTLRVDTTAIKCPLKSLDFITLKVKDAVCDKFRAESGERPSIDTREPDIRISVFLTADRATLYLDTSGEPLYKRGYRQGAVEAPLRENLAAGILKLTGWQPGEPLLDPMCGGGTFLVEAAQIALNIAPGGDRWFAFEKFRNFNPDVWGAIYREAEAAEKPRVPLPIYGSDLESRSVRATRTNLEAAGLEGVVTVSRGDVREIAAPAPAGVLVMNPPYGERLSDQDELAAFYPELGTAFKRNFAGWRAYVITADLRLAKLIRLAPSRRTPLFNGALECRLFEFKLVAGSNRKEKEA